MVSLMSIVSVFVLMDIRCRSESQVTFQDVIYRKEPVTHSIDPASLPAPYASPSVTRRSRLVPLSTPLTVPPGFKLNVFSGEDQGHSYIRPRQMVLAPNGDVFLTDERQDILYVLRDVNKDGVADQRFVFANATLGLLSPFGIAFHGGYVYVASVDEVLRFNYTSGQTAATGPGELVVNLTSEGRRGHTTRDIKFSPDGTKFYISVGSIGNVDIETDEQRAAISVYNADGTNRTIFASGIRNPVGLAFNPTTNVLWTAVNERDHLGENLVPDYVTSVHEGGFYGFPYSYIGQNIDPRIRPNQTKPDLVEHSIVPDVLLTSHSAALGLAFYTGNMFPAEYKGDAFVALHGSWNRQNMTGYKVIRIRFGQDGKPRRNEYMDFLTGWLPAANSSDVSGRPVGVMVNTDGSLLVTDDGARKIWRVSYSDDSSTNTASPATSESVPSSSAGSTSSITRPSIESTTAGGAGLRPGMTFAVLVFVFSVVK